MYCVAFEGEAMRSVRSEMLEVTENTRRIRERACLVTEVALRDLIIAPAS